ncbi:unnamed protein product [Angiostrongylus costaricensis]|uniref:Secreted protein n=1 Tax=Angiostrongylus costaricensis TaxID=334426 RepID=A0A0R3PI31_ANGCS|nr:unnamed protein product [Angiostrongylus costaricensis]
MWCILLLLNQFSQRSWIRERERKLRRTRKGIVLVVDLLPIQSVCFFVLPVVWSSMFHLLPLSPPTCTSTGFDPWSGFTDL